jgi:hypothetical protein
VIEISVMVMVAYCQLRSSRLMLHSTCVAKMLKPDLSPRLHYVRSCVAMNLTDPAIRKLFT